MAYLRLGLFLGCSFLAAAAAAAACGNFSGADTSSDADAGADATGDSNAASADASGTTDGSKQGVDSGKPASGTLTTLAKATNAQGLFVNDNYVYYTTSDFVHLTNEVGRISKKSGILTKLAGSETAVQQVVTLDDDYVFWTTWGDSLRGVRSGSAGMPQTLIGPSSAWFAIGLVGNTNVVAAEFGGRRFVLPPTFAPGLDGGPYVPAVTGDVYATADAGDGGDAGLVTPSAYSHFQSSGGEVFWTNEASDGSGGVYSAASDGTVTRWALDQANPWGLAVSDKYIVYTTYGVAGQKEGRVVRIDRVTKATKVLADNFTRLAGVLISGADVYFAEFADGGSVWRVPLDGSTTQTAVAEAQHQPQSLAQDADAIYFTLNDTVNGGVVRMQK